MQCCELCRAFSLVYFILFSEILGVVCRETNHILFRKPTWKTRAFNGFVRGVTLDSTGTLMVAVGDSMLKIWALSLDEFTPVDKEQQASTVHTHDHFFTSVDHRVHKQTFATSASNLVQIWDHERSKPVQTHSWSNDTVTKVKINQVEPDIIAACSLDRGVFLADTRMNVLLHKTYLFNRANSLSWNPREAYVFSVANEDSKCYTFDMRRLDSPLLTHTDHLEAVIDIDYSPTGHEFVTASYDQHIRIFPVNFAEVQYRSREAYHTTRMNRIFSVLYSTDSTFIFSGSDDTNIRMWKTEASVPLRPMGSTEKRKMEYNNKLKEKFKDFPQIRSIANFKHYNRKTYLETKRSVTQRLSRRRTMENVKAKLSKDPEKAKKQIARVAEPAPVVTTEQ